MIPANLLANLDKVIAHLEAAPPQKILVTLRRERAGLAAEPGAGILPGPERLEQLAILAMGAEEVRQGKTRPARELLEELRARTPCN